MSEETVRTPTRQERRRERTRASLIGAAQQLFAGKGVEATAIAEITEAADVGFGSFYNYFDSKDEIAEAVLEAAMEEQRSVLFALIDPLTDPAESVALAHAFLIRQAIGNPNFGWLLVRLDASHRLLIKALGDRARKDIRDGLKAGRFVSADVEVSFFGTGGALLLVMRALLDGDLKDGAGVRHCEGVLRMLGVPDEDVVDIAARANAAVAS
jgi:AcrR family transcriptional regulator